MTNGNGRLSEHPAHDEPMLPEEFAAYVEQRLAADEDSISVLGREGMRLRLRVREQDAVADLDNLYTAYTRNPGEIDSVMHTLIRVLLGEMPTTEPQFAQIEDRIMPMLKPIGLLATVRERNLPMLLYREFLADLIITYVIDEERSISYIHEGHIERWNVTQQDIHSRALENLRRRTTEDAPYTRVGDGEQRLYVFNKADGYDATRLLLTNTLAAWANEIPGDLVVGIPNRDFLIAFSDANQDILRNIAQQVQADANMREHGLTDQLFTFSGGVIREYMWE